MEIKIYDWNKLSTKRRVSLSGKENLVFVAGGREMSKERVRNLIETYGQEQNYLLFGVLKDTFIPEMEFAQFKSLKFDIVSKVIDSLGEIGMGKIRILNHRHEDIQYVISELKPEKVVFISGSYKRAIHLRTEYWKAMDVEAKITMESPFLNESEALTYEKKIKRSNSYKVSIDKFRIYTEKEILVLAEKNSSRSFDWIFPNGAVLAEKNKPVILAHNTVLPFETYSALHGSLREINKSPAGDQNYYDTNHAEIEILEKARRRRIGLRGKTLYVTTFPCPSCSRILSRTELSAIVYSLPYSDNFGLNLLTRSGIKIKQVSL
ncbi:hypothetical protein JW796_02945 [Candidatus Dojkabacteria bacterium]|nr:hypothetical protein [Candidatus Dojkabacteria bacterium]